MFEIQKNTSEPFFGNHSKYSARARKWLGIGLLALLFQNPIWATDPIAVDPDPDFTSTSTTIYVDASEPLDVASLAPGHYVIVVIAEDGVEQSFEVWVD